MASPTAVPGSPSNGSSQGSSQTSAPRRRSVGTKLTDEEYAQLESLAAAQGVTPGECVRELVLRAFGKPAAEATLAEQTVLSEVLAVRTILINLIYDLAAGHAIEPERMRELIAKADADKLDKALERLKAASAESLYGQCKTDSTGSCQIMGITPGSYHLFAFADDPQIDFRDADATKEFEDSGKAIKIAEGERQSVELTPVPDSN